MTPTPTEAAGARSSILGGTVNPGTVDENNVAAAPPQESLTWDKIAVPEGLEVPEPLQGALLEIFNNRDLSPAEIASRTLALHAAQTQELWDKQTQLWEETQKEWQDQTRALPEFQGGRYEQELGRVAKLLNKFGGSEVRKALTLTGAGNHPAIVQFLHKLSKEIVEDEPATGQVVSVTTPSRAQRLYGNNSTGG